MSSDDQWFLDHLLSIRNNLGRNFEDIAEAIDRTVSSIAGQVQPWIPEAVRGPVTGDTAAMFRPFTPPPPPKGIIERTQDWVLRHRRLAAAVVAFAGTTGVLIWSRNMLLSGRRRKARKAGNGSRKEIIVIAGSPHEPMTRSIANDLERRGFIVYITVMTGEEERLVRAEGRADILPLWIDITSVTPSNTDIHPSLHALHNLITKPQVPSPGMHPHICHLTGLILLPSPNYPTGPFTTISPSTLIDTINTRVISSILLTQQFLPLLAANKNGNPGSIVLLNPSIPTSLSLPHSTPEATSASALSGFAASLRRELQLQPMMLNHSIPVTELKLGNIDLGSQYSRLTNTNPSSTTSAPSNTDILSWDLATRAHFASSASASSTSQSPSTSPDRQRSPPTTIKQNGLSTWALSPFRPTASRDLHIAVYDALRRGNGGNDVVFVGRGARTYGLVGSWVPGGLVGWMLGGRFAGAIGGSGGGVGGRGWGSGSEMGWERV